MRMQQKRTTNNPDKEFLILQGWTMNQNGTWVNQWYEDVMTPLTLSQALFHESKTNPEEYEEYVLIKNLDSRSSGIVDDYFNS